MARTGRRFNPASLGVVPRNRRPSYTPQSFTPNSVAPLNYDPNAKFTQPQLSQPFSKGGKPLWGPGSEEPIDDPLAWSVTGGQFRGLPDSSPTGSMGPKVKTVDQDPGMESISDTPQRASTESLVGDYPQSGEAMQAFKAHVAAMPTEEKYDGGWFGKIGAALAGGATGWEHGPLAGVQAGRQVRRAPYLEALQDWQTRGGGLAQLADIETKEAQARASHMIAQQEAERKFQESRADILHKGAQTQKLAWEMQSGDYDVGEPTRDGRIPIFNKQTGTLTMMAMGGKNEIDFFNVTQGLQRAADRKSREGMVQATNDVRIWLGKLNNATRLSASGRGGRNRTSSGVPSPGDSNSMYNAIEDLRWQQNEYYATMAEGHPDLYFSNPETGEKYTSEAYPEGIAFTEFFEWEKPVGSQAGYYKLLTPDFDRTFWNTEGQVPDQADPDDMLQLAAWNTYLAKQKFGDNAILDEIYVQDPTTGQRSNNLQTILAEVGAAPGGYRGTPTTTPTTTTTPTAPTAPTLTEADDEQARELVHNAIVNGDEELLGILRAQGLTDKDFAEFSAEYKAGKEELNKVAGEVPLASGTSVVDTTPTTPPAPASAPAGNPWLDRIANPSPADKALIDQQSRSLNAQAGLAGQGASIPQGPIEPQLSISDRISRGAAGIADPYQRDSWGLMNALTSGYEGPDQFAEGQGIGIPEQPGPVSSNRPNRGFLDLLTRQGPDRGQQSLAQTIDISGAHTPADFGGANLVGGRPSPDTSGIDFNALNRQFNPVDAGVSPIINPEMARSEGLPTSDRISRGMAGEAPASGIPMPQEPYQPTGLGGVDLSQIPELGFTPTSTAGANEVTPGQEFLPPTPAPLTGLGSPIEKENYIRSLLAAPDPSQGLGMTVGERYTPPETMGTPAHERIAPYPDMIRPQNTEAQSSLMEMLTRGQPPAQPAPEVTGQIPDTRRFPDISPEFGPTAENMVPFSLGKENAPYDIGALIEQANRERQAREFYGGRGQNPPPAEMENLPPGMIPHSLSPTPQVGDAMQPPSPTYNPNYGMDITSGGGPIFRDQPGGPEIKLGNQDTGNYDLMNVPSGGRPAPLPGATPFESAIAGPVPPSGFTPPLPTTSGSIARPEEDAQNIQILQMVGMQPEQIQEAMKSPAGRERLNRIIMNFRRQTEVGF